MKRFIHLLALALAALAIFASCGRAATFTVDREGYRDPKSGAIYHHVSHFHATAYDPDSLVGVYRSPGGSLTSFYRVEAMDGVLTDGNYEIYVSDGVTLPSFSDMPLAGAALCVPGMTAGATMPVLFSFDSAAAERLRDALSNGVSFPSSRILATATVSYDLIFTHTDLPLAYQLVYREYDSEILVYEPLTADGQVPDLYPGIRGEKLNDAEAVFHFGTQLIYDSDARVCYPIEKLTAEDS